MATDVTRNQWQHLFEHLATILHELHVAAIFHLVVRAAQEAVVVADVVGKLGAATGRMHDEMRALRILGTFQNHSRGHIAKDEVAVAVAPFQMARGDFRRHDNRAAHAAGPDHVGGGLNAEGGRRTGDVHIKSKATGPKRLLDFDRNRRIGAFVVGRGADDQVNAFGIAARFFQSDLAGLHPDLGHDRQILIGPRREVRVHAGRVQHALFFHHIALFDS